MAGGARQQQVIPHRHVREQAAAFRNQRYARSGAAMRGQPCQVSAVEQNAAAARCVRTGQRAHQRGLAGAVGTDQRQDLARLHRKADAAHGLQQTVADVEVLHAEQGHAGTPPR